MHLLNLNFLNVTYAEKVRFILRISVTQQNKPAL